MFISLSLILLKKLHAKCELYIKYDIDYDFLAETQ